MEDITYSVTVYNNLDADQTFWESFETLDDAFEWCYNLIGDKFKNKNMSPLSEYTPSEEVQGMNSILKVQDMNWISNSDDGEWTIEIQPEVWTELEDEDEENGIDFYEISEGE